MLPNAPFAAQLLQGSRQSLNGGGLQGTLFLRSSGSEGSAQVLQEVSPCFPGGIHAQGGPPFFPDVAAVGMGWGWRG